MSLEDQPTPLQRESVHSNGRPTEKVVMARQSYKESRTPRAVYAHDATYDTTVLDEYYTTGDMNQQDTNKTQNLGPEPTPALPARSNLRATRLMNGFGLKIDTQQPPAISQPTPQDLYLSSEEDITSSADEFSDYDFDSDSEQPDRAPSRKSHEDTAKVVNVVFVGKPNIVELSPGFKKSQPTRAAPVNPQRSATPDVAAPVRAATDPIAATSTSSATPEPTATTSLLRHQRRRSRIGSSSTEPSILRRLSISSTPSQSSSQHNRSASVLSNIMAKPRPSFLSIDPYAGKTYHEVPEEEKQRADGKDEATTPKTPTAMLKKSFGIMRKRSRPQLRDDYNTFRDNLSVSSFGTVDQEELAAQRPMTPENGRRLGKRNPRDSLQILNASPASSISSAPPPPPSYEAPDVPQPNTGRNRILASFHSRKTTRG